MLPLPWFVVRFLERRLGLRSLVRLTCIDILLTLESVHPDHIAQTIKRKKMRQMSVHSLSFDENSTASTPLPGVSQPA